MLHQPSASATAVAATVAVSRQQSGSSQTSSTSVQSRIGGARLSCKSTEGTVRKSKTSKVDQMVDKTELKFDSLERKVLIEIVEALMQKYGSDAVELAAQIAQKSEGDQSLAIETRVDKPVSTQGSSKATAVAKFKAEKKEKNKKDFDMTR